MWWRVVLAGSLAVGAKAFSAPLQWHGLPGKSFVVAPKVLPNMALTFPGELTLLEGDGQTTFNFAARFDNTIMSDVGGCMEAHEDRVRINHCTGHPSQKWNWLPRSNGDNRIQLQGSRECIYVDQRDAGTSHAFAVKLRECDEGVSESWQFENTNIVPTSNASLMWHGVIASLAMSMLGAVSLFGVSWWKRTRVSMIQGGIAVNEGGVSLAVPIAVHQGGLPLIPDCAKKKHRMTEALMALSSMLLGADRKLSDQDAEVPAMMALSPHSSEDKHQFSDMGIAAAPIRLLSLDCTGTLFTFSASFGTLSHRGFTRGLASTPELQALVPSAEHIDERFPKAFQATWIKWPLFGQAAGISSFDWFRAVFELSVMDSPLAEDAMAFNTGFLEVWNILESEEGYKMYEDVIPFLEWARSVEGLQICAISNITEGYRDAVLPALGLDKYLDFGIYSKVAGVEKPDPAIFHLAAQRAGVDPCEILHIGDDIDKDAVGARDAGFQSILLDRRKGDVSRPETLPADIARIRSLNDARRRIELGVGSVQKQSKSKVAVS